MKKKNVLEFTTSMKKKIAYCGIHCFYGKKSVLEFTVFMKKEKKTYCNLHKTIWDIIF